MTPQFTVSRSDSGLRLSGSGDWTIMTIAEVDDEVQSICTKEGYSRVDYDLTGVTRLDTSGAYLLTMPLRRATEGGCAFHVEGTPGQQTLIETAANAQMGRAPRAQRQWYDTLDRLGRGAARGWRETVETLAFLGHFTVVLIKNVLNPGRVRWKSVVAQIETVGLDASPIIVLLSFFIGAVIAFMGASLLASFGAQVFMVDLVGVTVLREFGVLITAIMLAGRSASAFTAQLGAMKMRQEIDAMNVIGLDSFQALVVPRALACLLSAPVLTFMAMMSGLAGGMLVAWLGPTDISPVLFFARLREAVPIQHFWVGLVKAPVFAMFIAVIGCRQGMSVTGSVNSLGTRTTSSVVQAIFAVIVVDAIFAILFVTIDV